MKYSTLGLYITPRRESVGLVQNVKRRQGLTLYSHCM